MKKLLPLELKRILLSFYLVFGLLSVVVAQDMIVAQTSVSDAASPLVGGATNQVILGFSVTRTNVNTTTNFNSLVVNTSIDPTIVFSSAALYKNTSNTFSGATLIAGATATLNASNITFATTTYQTFAAGSGDTDVPYYFFVVATVKSTVPTTSAGVPQIQLSFNQTNVGFSALTPAAFSISGTNYSFQALATTVASLNAGANNVAASPLVAGATGKAVFGFSLTSNGSQTVTAINVQLSSDPSGKLGTWSLVRSLDADFATGGDNTTVAGGITFTPSATQVAITVLSEAITTSAKNYFLVANVDPAVTGATANIQASLAGANVTASTGSVTSTATGVNYAFIGVTTTIASLNAGANNVATSPIVAGATGRAVFGFSLTSNGSQTVTAINVQLSSDPSGKLGTWSLVRSLDADFATGGDNTTIAGGITFTPSATQVAITVLAEAITTSAKNYFLVANVDPAVTGATASIQASLVAANITASTGSVTGTATGTNYTFQTLTTTIASLNAGANNVAASPLVAGATGKAVFGFSLTSNGSQTVTAINVQLTSDPSGKLGTWSLVRSLDADFATGGDNTTIAGGITFTPSATQVAITVLSEAITTSAKNYFLVANVDPAVTGATANIQASLVAANVTAGTGTVTGTSTGVNYAFQPLTTTIGSLNAGANNVAASPLIGGTANRAVFGFSLTSNGSQTVTAINVQLSSDPSGKLGTWSLVSSLDADFATGGDNTTVAGGVTFTPSTTQVAITVLSEAITTSAKNYFLVATANGSVTSATANIQASLVAANVTVGTGLMAGTATGVNYAFNSSQNSTIALNGGTTTGILYENYVDEGDNDIDNGTSDSENLAKFRLRDPANDSDALPTILTGFELTIVGWENLDRIVIVNGDENLTVVGNELAEQAVGSGVLNFTGLSITAPDAGASNGDIFFTVRASFKTVVDDNEQVQISITNATTLTASSRLSSFTASSTNNDILVRDTKLVFTPGTITANVNELFSVKVEAQDDNGNVDVDEDAETVTLAIANPANTLNTGSQSLTETLTDGAFTWTQLSIAQSDPSYTFSATDGSGGDDNLSNAVGFITINSLGIKITNGVSPKIDSLDLCYGGNYQNFGTIKIEESDAAGFATGTGVTYSIQVPFGFEFDPAVTSAPILVGSDISAASSLSYSFGNTVVQFSYTVTGTGNINSITLPSLRIRYTLDTAPTDSLILRKGGTAVQAGNAVVNAVPHGELQAFLTSNSGYDFIVKALAGQPPIQPSESNFSNTIGGVVLEKAPTNPATTQDIFTGNGISFSPSLNRYVFSPTAVGIGNDYPIVYTAKDAGGCQITVVKNFDVYATSIDNLLSEYCENITAGTTMAVNPNKYDQAQYYPTWDPSTFYGQYSYVKYNAGSGFEAYYSKSLAIVGQPPSSNPGVWQKFGYTLESSNEYSVYIPSYKRVESASNNGLGTITLTITNHGYVNGSLQHMYGDIYDANWNYLFSIPEADYTITGVTANTFNISYLQTLNTGVFTNLYAYVIVQGPAITNVSLVGAGPDLQLTAANHGLGDGVMVRIYIDGINDSGNATTVINDWYTVNVIDANRFTITPHGTMGGSSLPYNPPVGYSSLDITRYRFSNPFVPQDISQLNSRFGTVSEVYVGFMVKSIQCIIGGTNTCVAFTYRQDPVRLHQLPLLDFGPLASSYCPEDPQVDLTGNQFDGIFSGTGVTEDGVGVNTGSFDPSIAPTGINIPVTYSYTDENGCTDSEIKNTFVFSAIPAPVAANVNYCQGATGPITVTATGNPLLEYLWYDDALLTNQVGDGTNFITGLTAATPGSTDYFVIQRSGSGCASTADQVTVTIKTAPSAAFTLPSPCEDRILPFKGPAGMAAWSWDYGDGATGVGQNTTHLYPDQGTKNVMLTVTEISAESCKGSITQQLQVGPNPKPAFTYDQTCEGDNTQFHGSDPTGNTSDYKWDFADGTRTDSSATYQNFSHQLVGVGSHLVTLVGYSSSKCYDSIQRTVSVLKYLQTVNSQNPYVMANNTGVFTGDGFWVVEDNGGNSSWEFDVAAKDTIVSTGRVWVTNNANGSTYNANDRSYVNSPCLNLNSLIRPVLSMDYIMNTNFQNIDGAVLEYSIDGGVSWVAVGTPALGGNPASGINWYNTQGFSSTVGNNSLYGWSGNLWNVDNGQIKWLDARHKLDNITPKSKVRLRVAFGSNADSEFEGFAFTNLKIETRNRILLTENFTNNNDGGYAANRAVYDGIDPLQAVKLQYHLRYPDADLNSEINEASQAARAAFYGIVLTDASIPRTFIDGESDGDIVGAWFTNKNSRRELIPSQVEVTVQDQPSEPGYLKVEIEIGVLQPLPDTLNRKPILHIALVEKTDVDGNEFVFRKFIGSPTGKRLMLPILAGPLTYEDSTIVEDGLFSIYNNNIAIVAFIQDELTKEVYQSGVQLNPTFLPTVVTGIEDPDYADRISLFPNPANNEINIQLPAGVMRNTPIQVIDTYGRTVVANSFAPGESTKTINTSELTEGVYIIQVNSPTGSIARRKIMVIHR